MIRESSAEDPAELDDHIVADIVAVDIIDRFEMVDIQDVQKALVGRVILQERIDLPGQRALVSQACQFIRVPLDADLPRQDEFPDAERICDHIQKAADQRKCDGIDQIDPPYIDRLSAAFPDQAGH